jgi:hypothetical protein
MSSFKRIVIVGGPVSGKTEVWKKSSLEFPQLFPVPEAAALLIDQLGLIDLGFDGDDRLEYRDAFWYACWRVKEVNERLCEAYAKVLGKSGLLLDRCLADYASYLSEGALAFDHETGYKFEEVCASYDLVLFLNGPSTKRQFMQLLEGSQQRLEDSFEANRDVTAATIAVWKDHPRLHHIPFCTNFDEKFAIVRELISNSLS